MTSTTRVSQEPRSGVLGSERRWFTLDVVVTGANGVAYLLGAGLLTELLGTQVSTLRGMGGFLVVFALLVGWYARDRTAGPRAGWWIVAVNLVWVAASVVVAAAGLAGFTALGRIWLVVQAVLVALFAVLQMRTLRSSRAPVFRSN